MSLFFRENPFFEDRHSLWDNDQFLLPSLIPSSGRGAISHPHSFFKHYRFSPYRTLEKQLSRALNYPDHDVFKLVDFSPKINVSEDDEHYYIHVDLPGMTKDEIKMEISEKDHTFTISGERESIFKDGDGKNKNKEKKDMEGKMIEKEVKEEKEEEKKGKNKKEKKNTKKGKNSHKTGKEKEEEKEVEKEKEQENEKEKEGSDKIVQHDKNETKINNKNEYGTLKYSLVECRYGKFKRSFTLPKNIDLEHITAKMENGELEVTFNKIVSDKKKNQIRTIQIQ